MIELDVRQLSDWDRAHDYLSRMLDFPDYYGRNLDALYDCLTDLDDTQVCFRNGEEGDDCFEAIYSVFQDAAACNEGLQLVMEEE